MGGPLFRPDGRWERGGAREKIPWYSLPAVLRVAGKAGKGE